MTGPIDSVAGAQPALQVGDRMLVGPAGAAENTPRAGSGMEMAERNAIAMQNLGMGISSSELEADDLAQPQPTEHQQDRRR